MKEIKLSQGKVALVDNDDYERINQYKWFYDGRRYAVRSVGKSRKQVFMHRLVMDTPLGLFTDHLNFNTLDNRRSNLRVCTKAENNRYRKIRSDNKVGFKGVRYDKNIDKYQARIWANGKRISLGYYYRPEIAHEKYLEASKKLYGEFAYA